MKQIILASQSPRRKQLLEWAEVKFDTFVQQVDETFPIGLPVTDIPVYIANQKANAAQSALTDDCIVVAADTLVILGKQIIGKPPDRASAIGFLSELSGRKHQVTTGVVIAGKQKRVSFSVTTEVWFHTLTAEQISFYVDKYQPFDKAGGYAIQEW